MTLEARAIRNPAAAPAVEPYGAARSAVMSLARFDAAFAEISSWPGYAATPLIRLDALAAELNLAPDWLNDNVSQFAPNAGPATNIAFEELVGLPGLRVSRPSARKMLAMKARAARLPRLAAPSGRRVRVRQRGWLPRRPQPLSRRRAVARADALAARRRREERPVPMRARNSAGASGTLASLLQPPPCRPTA